MQGLRSTSILFWAPDKAATSDFLPAPGVGNFLSVYFFSCLFFFDALSWSPARPNRGPQVLSMSRHSGSVNPQEQRVLFSPPTTGSNSTIRPDFEPEQVFDDLVSQWFEEIEETGSPNKQLLPQFNLCAVPEFYSDPGLPVIPCDQIENPVL